MKNLYKQRSSICVKYNSIALAVLSNGKDMPTDKQIVGVL